MPPDPQKTQAIFHDAIEHHAAAEWPAFLDRACAGDVELRSAVEALLRGHEQANSLLDDAAHSSATADEVRSVLPGTVIGRYKLIEPIGEGGMGIVWMAQQTEPVKRLVAVKLIKRGMDSKAVLARFEAERQALALMDHPNIARVLDADTTTAGQPYFVMDLVKGVPITKYCDEHRLTPRQRLELFVPVCHAIQHAHQKGIIHRDLKPSNVLVALYDGKPVPKIIDFGVAKAAGQPLTEQTLVTGFGAIVGTLEYMSPEQAEINQLDIDTRSDIYSLGVLLYELLAGSPPFSRKKLENAGMLEMLRVIREEEPTKPSTKLSTAEGLPTLAANRGTEPAKLTKLVRGELDWIVMKALEKDRNRRYETANGFAMDVQRYLADEAVQACPPSVSYRLRKFARRNKAALVTCAVLLAAILGVAATIGWASRDRAIRAAEIEKDRDRALDEAARLRDRGSWSEALAAVVRAKERWMQGATPEQHERLRQIEEDLTIAMRVEELGVRLTIEFDVLQVYAEADQEYYNAFRDYGIDCAELDEQAVAEHIRRSAIREALLVAVDDWAWCRGGLSHPKLYPFITPYSWPLDLISSLPAVKLNVYLPTVGNLVDEDEDRKRVRFLAASPADPPGLGSIEPPGPLRKDLGPIPPDFRELARKAMEEFAMKPQALELRPASAVLLTRALGTSDRPREILRAAHQRYPADLRLNVELARNYRGRRPSNGERAAGFLRAAIALRPESATLHASLGANLKLAGDREGSLQAYRTAIRFSTNRAEPHFEIGAHFRDTGAWEEAIGAFSNAIALTQGRVPWAPARAARGGIYARLGRWELAAADYKHVTLLDYYQWIDFASVYLLAGQHEHYREHCIRIISSYNRTFAGGPERWTARIDSLTARSCLLGPDAGVDRDQIMKLAESAVAIEPSASHQHTLGMAHYRAGAFEKAIASFQASMNIRPEWDATVCNWLALAMANHQLGRRDEARRWLEKAVKWIDQEVAKAPKGTIHPIPGIPDHDSLPCHVMRREAEVLLQHANGDKSASNNAMR